MPCCHPPYTTLDASATTPHVSRAGRDCATTPHAANERPDNCAERAELGINEKRGACPSNHSPRYAHQACSFCVHSRVRPSFRTTQARSPARHLHIFSKPLPPASLARYAYAYAAYAYACACSRARYRPRPRSRSASDVSPYCFVFRPLVAYRPLPTPSGHPPLATSCCQRTQQRPPSPQQHAVRPSAGLPPPCPV